MEVAINDSLSKLALNQLDSKFGSVRAEGWASFQQEGWPTRRNEEYKFTALDQIISKKFDFKNVTGPKAQDTKSVQSNFYKIEGYHLVFVNGDYRKDLSTVPVGDLSIRSFEELSSDELKNIVAKQKDKRATVAINQAFVGNGIVVNIPKSANPLPVFVYHFNASSNASVSFPRIHMSAEENAHVRCYERTFNSSESHFSSSVQTFELARHASIRFTKIQDFGKNDMVLDNMFVNQAADSHFFANTFSFSGGLIRNNLEIDVNGEHSEANMYGLYLLDGQSHVDNHTVVDHKVANCNSNEMYKGVVDEQSTAVFNGKIFVRQAAQKTNAFQANNNVSLSDQATIHTKPQLEIWADDVKCSHGCTIGQLDEEALFYLQSRGIRPKAAKAMLLNAFAKEALVNIQQDEVKNEIIDLIYNRLVV
jgi:Fe-S cluster assembly protein SufD